MDFYEITLYKYVPVINDKISKKLITIAENEEAAKKKVFVYICENKLIGYDEIIINKVSGFEIMNNRSGFDLKEVYE